MLVQAREMLHFEATRGEEGPQRSLRHGVRSGKLRCGLLL
jgi:hypothetical protein